jgi:hypothetical protein
MEPVADPTKKEKEARFPDSQLRLLFWVVNPGGPARPRPERIHLQYVDVAA